jgi:hypothetical protein
MRKQRVLWTIGMGFVFALIALSAGRPAAGLTQEAPADTAAPESTMVEDTRYAAYGFLFEQYSEHERFGGFTEHEIKALGVVIEAFAEHVGGAARLHTLVNGPVRVRRDLHEVVSYTQAGRIIGLGRGAFDLAVTTESNYYTWGAESGDELAQIVFGHEIGHRWLETLRRDSDTDWGVIYAQNVWRGERPSKKEVWDLSTASSVSPEEEAVTNLALAMLGKRRRWTFLHDAPAKDQRQVYIDGWVSDVMAAAAPEARFVPAH